MAAGYTLLKASAKCPQSAVRQTDFVGRLGGDEFCIILDNIKAPENAIVVAEKILQLACEPIAFEPTQLSISTSIGIAFAHAPTQASAQYIALADAALCKAKRAGRNGYVLDRVAEAAGSRAVRAERARPTRPANRSGKAEFFTSDAGSIYNNAITARPNSSHSVIKMALRHTSKSHFVALTHQIADIP